MDYLSRRCDIVKAAMFEMLFVPIRRITLSIRRGILEECPVLKHFSQQEPTGNLEILLCQIFHRSKGCCIFSHCSCSSINRPSLVEIFEIIDSFE